MTAWGLAMEHWPAWALWGLAASAAMAAMLECARAGRTSRKSMPFLFGTLVVAARRLVAIFGYMLNSSAAGRSR